MLEVLVYFYIYLLKLSLNLWKTHFEKNRRLLKLFSATQRRSVLKVADTLGQNFYDVRTKY